MKKPKKAPPDIPERVADRCALRADKLATGTLVKFDPESDWATVSWDNDGPKICHRFELTKI